MQTRLALGQPRVVRGVGRLHLGILALLITWAVSLTPAHAAQELASTVARVRIGVNKDGITVVAPSDLAQAGIDLNGVDPRSFALSSLGQPVAFYLTGEGDARFDGNDRLYFFGEKFRGPEMDQKYTDERVYWLDMGGAPGPRMMSVNAAPQFDRTPPADFATTIHAEQSEVWWTLYSLSLAKDTQDTWFWKRLSLLSGQSITATLPYTVPYPANASGTLRLEEISNAHSQLVVPDHRTKVAINGTGVLDQTWDGLRLRKVFSSPVPAGLLNHGINNIAVGAWTVQGTATDEIYVNYWELDYRRLFQAWQDQLDFRAEAGGTQEYEVAGFSGPDVWIWDVTDPQAPVRLLANPSVNLKTYLPLVLKAQVNPQAPPSVTAAATVRFRVDGLAGDRYWLQAGSALQRPTSVTRRLPTALRNPPGGADAVIVTSAELRQQAERLAQWHQAHGRRALVVDIQDAYDEFNDGIFHPKGVQAMMKWASVNWASPGPAYLTLFGDGHWNFKNNNPTVYPGGPNQVPPYLAFEDHWQGEVPVDARYGDLNDDKLPDIAVGRLAVNNLAEAAIAVDKILTYDEDQRLAAWQRKAIFVADNADLDGDYPAASDEIIANYTPQDLQVTRVYLPPAPAAEQIAATKDALRSAWNDGAFIVQYMGHGAPERWTHEFIMTTSDVTSGIFNNGSRLPIVLTFNCLDGYFAHAQPNRTSLAESMQRAAGGGSIGAISPAGLGTTDAQSEFRQVLLTVMFEENVREVGRALTIAKQRYAEVNGPHYLTQTMMLFGDPAMRLPAAAPAN